MENMNENIASNASNNTETTIDGYLVSKSVKLSKKQLKVLSSLKRHTLFGVFPKQEQLRLWNGLMKKKRENIKLLYMAIMGSQHYIEGERNSIGWNDFLSRLTTLHTVDEIILESEKVGNRVKTVSMLSWIGVNLQSFTDKYLYQGLSLCEDIKTEFPEIDKSVLEQIKNEFTKVANANKILLRVFNYRQRFGYPNLLNKERERLESNTLVKRYDAMVKNIASIHPLRWTRSLPSFQQKLASKFRPSGECLGIELEFVAAKGSEIVMWDSDEYHNYPFLQFKGDGSISPNRDTEELARFQELTYFINGSSSKDWATMKEVLDDMVTSGARVNTTCGNHVHIDMRHRTHSSALRTATKVRESINNWAHRLVSFNRSNNNYCGINREHSHNRYTAVNIQCLGEHNTIEVRLGMPTLNFYKLKYWSQFLQYLATPRTSVATFEDFMQSDASVDLKHYAFKRILKFQDTYVSNGLQPLHNFNNYSNAFSSIDGGCE